MPDIKIEINKLFYMKNLIKLLTGTVLTAALILSCKKDENKVFFSGGTNPVLTASSTVNLFLDSTKKNTIALTFNWTNPNYQFNTGNSSQNVTYILQVDTTGSNFTNPAIQEVSIANDLSRSFTVKEVNTFLNKLLLQADKPHNMEFRVKSSLNGSVPLFSNVIKIIITPYLDAAVAPPGTPALNYSDGELFIVGSATNGDWNNPVPVPSQKFTKLSITSYTITLPLIGGKEYLFLPKNGDWSKKYGNACGSNSCNNDAADDFKAQGDNFKGPALSGTYKITVNFISGKFTVVKQ